MEEHGWLRHFRLLQLFVSAFEYDVRDSETKDVVGFLKKLFSYGVLLVKVLAHSYELGTLPGKYKCFHVSFNLIVAILILYGKGTTKKRETEVNAS